jgi:hypothetical protein
MNDATRTNADMADAKTRPFDPALYLDSSEAIATYMA